MMHGWGGNKTDFEALEPERRRQQDLPLQQRLLTPSTATRCSPIQPRGWSGSCGSRTSRAADPTGCAQGWIHLADQRYEAHDTQYLLGLLVDEGVTKPDAIGVTGISYGGGQSVELAFLRNRIRLLPSQGSGSRPGRAPRACRCQITAAYPRWPWSDLVESLEPNGRFLDFNVPSVNDSRVPLGIAKASYVEGLYGLGVTSGYYAPPGADPNADLTSWNARVLSGEPEDASATAIAEPDRRASIRASGCRARPPRC